MCMSTVIFAKKSIESCTYWKVPRGVSSKDSSVIKMKKFRGKRLLVLVCRGGGHDDTKPEGTTVA